MDDPPLVTHGDVPARSSDHEIVKQKNQPSVFTRGRSPTPSRCTSSEQQHPSQAFSDLTEGTKTSPLARTITVVTYTSDPDPVVANPAAPLAQDDMSNIMESPNFAALEMRKVQRLFERGVPLFTKRDMEDLRDQIEASKKEGSTASQKFIFKSVTGRNIERAVVKGLSLSRRLGNKEGRLEPCILYNSYQALVHNRYFSDQPPCAMSICHRHQIEPQQQSSLQDIRNTFWTQWYCLIASEQYRRLRSAIMETTVFPVDTIFAFACGSISGEEDNNRRRRSAMQHAFMWGLRMELQEKFGKPINCVAQDPAYTAADKMILLSLGIAVVDDPQGFLGVTNDSVVLSFCPNVPVRQIITDIARPAILAWDTVTDEEDTIRRWTSRRGIETPKAKAVAGELEACETDPPSSRVRNMIAEHYTQVQRLDTELFGESSVYIRTTKCSG